jgi:predicted membrane protein
MKTNFESEGADLRVTDLPNHLRRSTRPPLIVAVFMIVAGAFLFLCNVGILPVRNPWAYWPIALIVAGIARLFGNKTLGTRWWSLLMILFGSLFLTESLGIFHFRPHDRTWPISILLITAGIVALAKILDTSAPRKPMGFPRSPATEANDFLNEAVVMGSWKRRIDSADFRGGQVQAVMGNIEVDLRNARISSAPFTASIDVSLTMASVKLQIPQEWRVVVHGTAHLGSIEDRTIPQAKLTETGTLVVTGYVVLGSVEIEN